MEEKGATSVDAQIAILESRGMKIENPDKAKEILLDIGYFRLGFYWFPFEKTYPKKVNRDHKFKDGTKLSYAVELYYFDFDLRNLFLPYISRIEINFRTKLIYYASNRYKEDPFWYLNDKYLNKEFIESKLYKGAVEEACKEPVAKQDLERHDRKNVPAWKILESMTFGTTIMIFENLKEEDLKRHISKEFGIVSYKQFFNYVNALRRLRNYCAHGKVLFDLNLSNSICNGPAGNLDSIKSRLAGAYRILEYMLNRVSTNRKTDLVNSINRIFNKIEDAEVKRVIYNSTGFKPNI